MVLLRTPAFTHTPPTSLWLSILTDLPESSPSRSLEEQYGSRLLSDKRRRLQSLCSELNSFFFLWRLPKLCPHRLSLFPFSMQASCSKKARTDFPSAPFSHRRPKKFLGAFSDDLRHCPPNPRFNFSECDPATSLSIPPVFESRIPTCHGRKGRSGSGGLG